MSFARQMLDSRPRAPEVDAAMLARTIDALQDCAQACLADTDDDLGEKKVSDMVTCIRLCLDCADICTAALRVLSRGAESGPGVTGPLLAACVAVCAGCADECERHAAMHEHCRVCGEACRQCEQACRALATVLS